MLIIWTTADAALIRKVIGPIVGRQSIPHRIDSDITKMPHMEAGDVLLACGGKALVTLLGLGLVPKGRTITSLRDKALPASNGSIFMTFDPVMVQKEYARLPEIQWDVQLAIRMHVTGTTKPPIGKYRYVESLHEMVEKIDAEFDRTGKPVVVTADLETLGLDEYNPEAWIIACSFTMKSGTADVLYFDKGECPSPSKKPWHDDTQTYWEGLWDQLHWMFTSRKVTLRGANFKYDSRWIHRKWGIDVTNLKMDTLLVGSLIDENRSNSLKLHAKIYTPMGGYEDDMKTNYDMGRIDLVPKQKLLPYVGGDTDATYQVSDVLREELVKDRRLADFYVKILHPSSKVFEKMERTGVCLDIPYYHKLQNELENEIERLDILMKRMIPRKLAIKYMDNFSLTRPALMREFLFTKAGLNLKPTQMTAKGGDPSTAMDHLMTFEDVPEAKQFIDLLKESNSASKTLSTFVIGFLKHLRSDGRFHPSYRLARGGFEGGSKDSGTVTGRTSASDPAVQTIPKHTKWSKKLRRAMIPPPGKTILQIDYSQGELKITACLAEEPVMIAAYANGADLHAITAAQLSGYSYTDFMLLPDDIRDELRSGGKAGNFGLIYGMGASGFQEYAFATYGVKMTEQEATQKRTAFFELYKRLPAWHTEYKNFAKNKGYVRSPLGRIRHLPLINSKDREAQAQAERQSINSPVQSCLSDMMQLAMIMIDKQYGDQVDMFMMTHDACAFYVPLGEEVVWAKRLKEIMDNLPLKQMFGWDHQLQFTTDAECCTPDSEGVLSFAYLKKLKGL